jgi:putative ABC transport system substrate-binding protein
VEGKNTVIDYRYAEGKFDRLPARAAELVNLKADVIVTTGGISTRSAKEATASIPNVMVQEIDPVGNGFVTSLARPGRNITGLSTLAPEISGKQMALLKGIVRRLPRVAVLGTTTNPGTAQALKETELAARALKVQFRYLDVFSPKDIDTVFRTASQARAEAVLVLISSVLKQSAKSDHKPRHKEPPSSDVPFSRICRSRWTDELRREFYRLVSARGNVRGQNLERRQAFGAFSGTANEIRIPG